MMQEEYSVSLAMNVILLGIWMLGVSLGQAIYDGVKGAALVLWLYRWELVKALFVLVGSVLCVYMLVTLCWLAV